jgi:hypothetical protein
MKNEKYLYSKTLARIRDVERLLLEGMTTATCRQTLSKLWDWQDLSERHARRYVHMAKKKLKERFEKDAEIDYQWCRENYMRLFREAYNDDDRSEQRALLNDFRKLSGLDETVVTHKLDVNEEDLEKFNSIFN